MTAHTAGEPGRGRRWVLWTAGLVVALGAGVATAHGLFEVAVAAGVPEPIAWLYPLITDGLALVAYVSTARLTGGGRTYAWSVVVLAAGLSGLAQAAYLADGVSTAAAALRFGVGAWPAIAAAIVAHLLFLLGTDHEPAGRMTEDAAGADAIQPEPSISAVQPGPFNDAVRPGVQPSIEHPPPAYNVNTSNDGGAERTTRARAEPTVQPATRRASSARSRALKEARRHGSLHGSLPTVSQLMELANVARGTAGTALKELRDQPTQLHVVNDYDTTRSDQ